MVGYHLPLDAHPVLGNNAQLARRMDWVVDYQCGEQKLLNIGHLLVPQTLSQLAENLKTQLDRSPTVIGNDNIEIKKIAWCTGGAQGFFQTAIEQDVDVFITGEISESQYHIANETGVAFISAGHHATERYGVLALGEALSKEFSLSVQFFDERNPA